MNVGNSGESIRSLTYFYLRSTQDVKNILEQLHKPSDSHQSTEGISFNLDDVPELEDIIRKAAKKMLDEHGYGKYFF